jgi:hypothetical protein
MNAATPNTEPPLTRARPWAKSRAAVVVIFTACFTFANFGSRAAPNALADLVTAVTLATLWALALWAVVGVRAHTTFSKAGIVDVGVLRTVSLPWELVTSCTLVEKTVRSRNGTFRSVLIRFASRQADSTGMPARARPRERAIELTVPDAAPLAPGILALLRTIPQLSNAPWSLLEPTARRDAADADRARQPPAAGDLANGGQAQPSGRPRL